MIDSQTLAMLPPQVLAAYLRDPKTALYANMISEGTDTSPVKSPWEGLARMVKAGVGAYKQGQLEGDYQKQAQDIAGERNRALAMAVGRPAEQQSYGDGTTINWNAQSANPAAALATLGPGNQDLQGELLRNVQQEQQFGREADLRKSLQRQMLDEENARQQRLIDAENARQRAGFNQAFDLEKFKLEHDPAKREADMIANYMASFMPQGGASPPQNYTPAPPQIPPMPSSALSQPAQGGLPPPPTPSQLSQGGMSMPSATVGQVTQPPTVGGVTGFNPIGALVAKKFGLENMQIGPNGQLTPVPGTGKFAEATAKEDAKAVGDARQAMADTADFINNLGQVRKLVTSTPDASFGPIAGRINNLSGDPNISNIQSAFNDLALRAKAMLKFPSNNFSDADRNFLQSLTGNVAMQKGGLLQIMDRMEQISRRAYQNNQSLVGYGEGHGGLQGYQPQLPQGRVKVVSPDGRGGTIDASELPQALQNGWKQVP